MKTHQDRTRRVSVVGKLALSLFLALVLLSGSTTVWASHNGPVFFVDDDNPVGDDMDGDYHFHSIQAIFDTLNDPKAFPKIGENDRILVDPGTYVGNITISVKGVVLESTEGRDLTKFEGSITISAKDVKVIGFDLDATGQDSGFVVRSNNALLQGNKAHNAKAAGIVVEDSSDEVQLLDNEVFNNGTEGIHVQGNSDNGLIQNNQIRSNGAIGVFVSESSDRITVSDNDVSLNQSEGIKVQGSDGAEVSANRVKNNALDGVRFEDANDGTIANNQVNSSGGFGISVVDSDNNSVNDNTTGSNDGGGIAVRGSQLSAQRNEVLNNTITDNIRAGSAGVLLEGDASSNKVQANTISSNSFGVRLKSTSMGGAPGNNLVEKNDILDSPEDGIEVSGSAGRNRFVGNTLSGNNKAGVHLNNAEGNDEVLNNKINNNGHQGVLAEGSPRNTIAHNEIKDNGREGVALADASNNNVLDNAIDHNRKDGIALSGASDNNDIEDNQILNNRQNGVNASGANNLDLRHNVIQGNVARGVSFDGVSGADVANNEISSSNTGGVWINASGNLDIEQNNIHDNVQFGLNASDTTELKADRNWWGSGRGPAGAFEGQGNAVLGVDVPTQVFPWLTAPYQLLRLGSTAGRIIDDFGFGDPASFLAMDKSDADVDFFKVNAEENGLIITSKFENFSDLASSKGTEAATCPSPFCVGQLQGAIKALSVLVSGLNSGTTLINVKYNESELNGATPETLRLYYWDPTCDAGCSISGGRWVQLPGQSRSNVNIVEGEISVDILKQGRIIALAPGGN